MYTPSRARPSRPCLTVYCAPSDCKTFSVQYPLPLREAELQPLSARTSLDQTHSLKNQASYRSCIVVQKSFVPHPTSHTSPCPTMPEAVKSCFSEALSTVHGLLSSRLCTGYVSRPSLVHLARRREARFVGVCVPVTVRREGSV